MKVENMQLNLLRTFVIVAKYQNASLAAEELHCDKSNIIKQLKNLEEVFGKKLYFGRSNGIELTSAGKILYDGASKAINLLMLTEKLLNESTDIENGKISLAIKDDIREFYLKDIIDSFIKKYPKLQIKFLNTDSKDMINRLDNYNIDLIVDNNSNIEKYKNIELINEELRFIYCSEDQLSSNMNLILYTKENNIRHLIDKYLKSENINYKLCYEFNDSKSIIDFVKEGRGVGIVPKTIADKSGVKVKPLTKNVNYIINVVYKDEFLSPATKELIDFLKEAMN